MSSPVNELLKIYLGTDSNGGYQPIGCEQRLHTAFPDSHEQKMKEIQPYLAGGDQKIDWWKSDLPESTAAFAAALGKEFPELEAVVVKSLANRVSYGYR